jgi:inosine/xanthosine triphosphate pyrophosphatase family protein
MFPASKKQSKSFELRNTEYLGLDCIGILARCVAYSNGVARFPEKSTYITGNPHLDASGNEGALSQLKKLFAGTLATNTQCVTISIATECDKHDEAWMVIAKTAMAIAVERFPEYNIVVKIVNNPYKVRDAASVPMQTAKALYDGIVNFFTSQSNMFGICSTNALFSLAVSYDFRGKTCSPEARLLTTTYPGNIMYHIEQNDMEGRLHGSKLTETIARSYSGTNGYIVASSYGIAQKPIALDSRGMVVSQIPSIKFAYSDDVRVSDRGDFSVFSSDYHGVLMSYPYLGNSGIEKTVDGDYMFASGTAVYNCLRDAIGEIQLPDRFTLTFGLLTSNPKKVVEVKAFSDFIFQRLNRQHGNLLKSFRIVVQQIVFTSMAEGQFLDPITCTENKVDGTRLNESQIAAILGLKGIMIDDTSFFVESLNMQPGTYYKGYYDQYELTKAARGGYGYNNFLCDGVNKFVAEKTAEYASKGLVPTVDDVNGWRKAIAITVFACHFSTPWSTVYDSVICSQISGIIPEVPTGRREFGWDTIFRYLQIENDLGQMVPASGKTYADNSDEENALSKPRGGALKKIFTKVLLLMKGMDIEPEQYEFGMTTDEQTQSVDAMKASIATFETLVKTGHIDLTASTNATVSNSKAVDSAALTAVFSTFS